MLTGELKADMLTTKRTHPASTCNFTLCFDTILLRLSVVLPWGFQPVGSAQCDSEKVGLRLCNESSIVGTEISSIPEDCNGSVICSTLSAESIPSDGESVDGSILSCDSLCHDDPITHNKSFTIDPPDAEAFLDTLPVTESGPVACKHNKSDPDPSLLLSHAEEDFFSDALDVPEDIFHDAQACSNGAHLEPTPPLVALVDLHPADPFVFPDNEVVVGTHQSGFDVSVVGNIETLLFDGCSPVDNGADTVCCGGDCVNDGRNPSQQRRTCHSCAWSR